ncbi:MAG: 5-oxoprolinase subunit PxpB [Ginsengibacter sp.]
MDINPVFPYTIFPLGDSALTLDFGNIIDTGINTYVLSLFHHFKEKKIAGISGIVPAYSSLGFYYNVPAMRQTGNDITAFEMMKQIIEKELNEDIGQGATQQRKISIPVCYSKTFAPDIEFIASEKNISIEKIIRLHTHQLYTVYMIGFLPGFPYMGTVDEGIAVPRKKQPRTIVPQGSVGIAGKQTGIYPLESPGGWQIIGRTPLKIFDKEKSEPVLLQPGDEIQFYSISEDEFENY